MVLLRHTIGFETALLASPACDMRSKMWEKLAFLSASACLSNNSFNQLQTSHCFTCPERTGLFILWTCHKLCQGNRLHQTTKTPYNTSTEMRQPCRSVSRAQQSPPPQGFLRHTTPYDKALSLTHGSGPDPLSSSKGFGSVLAAFWTLLL